MQYLNCCGKLLIGLALSTLLVSMAPLAYGEEAGADAQTNPHVWKPEIKSVAVFKNGLGFFMREGDVALREGWCAAGKVPPAAFGTLAIYAHGENSVVDIVGSGPGQVVAFDDRDAASDIDTKRRRLESHLRLNVQLEYTHKGQERTTAGTLVSVGPQFVVLEDNNSNFAVPLAGLQKMQVLELPLRIHVDSDADTPPEREKLGMAYLRKGITWIPDYTLQILDEETAELTLRGTLVNEAEDLVHTDVHLVVGVPHFVHTDYLAPIAVGQAIRTISAAVSSQQVPQQVTTQIMNRAAIVQNAAPVAADTQVVQQPVQPDAGLEQALGDLPQLGGAAATDYTVYTKQDLTLRRGEKAIITLFTRKIRLSHVYRWNTSDRIKHSLLLHNSTDTPWTTGPCLVLSDGSPLSEDILNYTPKGASGELPVTAAINIAHSKTERETDRELKSHHITSSIYFDRVILDGEIKLHNYERQTVEIAITNPVPGKPLRASDDGTLRTDSTQLKLDERRGTISWRLELEPGERKTLTYQYERYVRSN